MKIQYSYHPGLIFVGKKDIVMHICSSGLVSILKFNLSVNHQVPHKVYYYSFSMYVICWSLIWLTICRSALLANWVPVNSNSNWDLFKVSCLIIIMQPGYKGLPTMKKNKFCQYIGWRRCTMFQISIFLNPMQFAQSEYIHKGLYTFECFSHPASTNTVPIGRQL